MKTIVYLGVSVLLSLITITSITFAEKPDNSVEKKVSEELSEFMDQFREPRPPKITKQLKPEDILRKVDAYVALKLIKPYEQDASWEVRHKAYRFGHEIAKSHPDVKIRQEMVTRLVKGLADLDHYQDVGILLLSYKSIDFNDISKKDIHNFLIKEEPLRQVVLACGVADMKEEMDRLEKLLIDETKIFDYKVSGKIWWHSLGWSARLARARMGSKPDIDRCHKLVEAEPDPVHKICSLLQDISYIRQPEVVEFLKHYLNSDERLPPVKKTDPGAPYVDYVISYLAEMLYDFPIKNEGNIRSRGGYSEEDIKLVRKWMSEQKEWKIIR